MRLSDLSADVCSSDLVRLEAKVGWQSGGLSDRIIFDRDAQIRGVGVVQIHRLHRFDDQARIAIGHKAAQPFRRYVLQLPGYRDIATIRAIASCTGGVLDDVGHSSLPFLSGRPGDNATSRQIAAAHRLPGSTPTVSPGTPPVCPYFFWYRPRARINGQTAHLNARSKKNLTKVP